MTTKGAAFVPASAVAPRREMIASRARKVGQLLHVGYTGVTPSARAQDAPWIPGSPCLAYDQTVIERSAHHFVRRGVAGADRAYPSPRRAAMDVEVADQIEELVPGGLVGAEGSASGEDPAFADDDDALGRDV